MSHEEQKTPLEQFREKIRLMKETECEKKRRAESGENSIWDPHLVKITESFLGEAERYVFENLDRLTRDEFNQLRRKRMEEIGGVISQSDAEQMMNAEGLSDAQRRIVKRIFAENGGISPKTPEQQTIDYFWQYLANKFSHVRRIKEDDL